MAGTKKKKPQTPERPLFDTIRKPLAPPSRTLGPAKPNERAQPSRRKAKHKKREEE
jgi:hypothetical protein